MTEYPNGLSLIASFIVPIKTGLHPITSGFAFKKDVPVPDRCQFAHVAITAVDMSYGETIEEPRNPSPVGNIFFEVTGEVKDGTLPLEFKAILQSAAKAQSTGKWSGNFFVAVLCFG